MKKILVLLTGFSLLSVSLFAGDPEVMRKAPAFTFTVPGSGQKALSQYLGKVVALEFIFTTCPHCQAASHVMSRFQEQYGTRGLQVIDVAINPNADLLVENFAKDYQVKFPVGWSTDANMRAFMGFDAGSRYVVPQLALIDRKGVIHYQTPATEDETWDAVMKEDAIRQNIEKLLSGSGSNSSRLSSKAVAPTGSR